MRNLGYPSTPRGPGIIAQGRLRPSKNELTLEKNGYGSILFQASPLCPNSDPTACIQRIRALPGENWGNGHTQVV